MSRTTRYARWIAIAVTACALGVSGCSGVPRINPSGESIFMSGGPGYISSEPEVLSPAYQCPTAPPAYQQQGVVAPNYQEEPGTCFPGDGVAITLTPQETVAPVGGEIALVAGVLGRDQYLRTNQKVEWTIASGGVGQFVDVGQKYLTDWLVLDFTMPRRLNDHAAIGSTTRKYLRLTRGTDDPTDDVTVLRGQAWITLTSPVEGVSYVTAYSPCIANWEDRRRTATIHWVDAEWSFPPPAINPAGSRHVLCTTVTRHTDHAPCVDWLVRYEIRGGPSAGFAPDGAQAVEVPTDASGNASVEIFQQQASPGTNQIAISVIRPAVIGGIGGKRLNVAAGTTMTTWSSADVAVRKTGPASATIGSTVKYVIEVSNPGDLSAEGVTVTDEIPNGMTYLGSNPSGTATGRTIQWQVGQLTAGETRRLEVDFRAERQGSVTACAEATAAGGLRSRACSTTTVTEAAATPPPIAQPPFTPPATTEPVVDLKISGPQKATVGQTVTFTVEVVNRGGTTARGLLIKDRFDAGFEHAEAVSPIERSLDVDLQPGQSRKIGVEFKVTAAGRQCHTVEILDRDGKVLATEYVCLTAEAAEEPKSSYTPPVYTPPVYTPPTPGPNPGPAGTPSVSLKVTGPKSRRVNETAEFTIEVANTSIEKIENVEVVSNLDMSFDPSMATGGYRLEGDAIVWTIENFESGDKRKYTLHGRCMSPTDRALNRVKVTSDGSTLAEEEASVRIEAAPVLSTGKLSMTVQDHHDPISVNKELTYEIKVVNNGQLEDTGVLVVVTVPPEMSPVRLGTWGPESFEVEGQTIRFNEVASIEAGGSIAYRVRVQTKQPGTVRLGARLTSRNQSEPLLKEEATFILDAP